MATVRNPLMSAAATGPLAGLLSFGTDRGRGFVRCLATRRAPATDAAPTTAQARQRAAYAAAVAAWHALSDAERAALSVEALALRLTGYNLHLSRYLSTFRLDVSELDGPDVLS